VKRDVLEVAGGRVERRKARTRAALLAAARELFASNGFQQTAIAEIAARADIAIGSFYNYFRTKEDLLDVLLEEQLSRQLELLQGRQQQVTDPAEKISVAHRHLVLSAREDPSWGWLIVRLEAPYRIAWTVLGDAAEQDLLEGIAAGEFQVADTGLALKASGGALFAVMHAELAGELGEGDDCAHAEGVLRSFGLGRAKAARIARRPLPPLAAAERRLDAA
jgi:AcrR family transcriptional regulator